MRIREIKVDQGCVWELIAYVSEFDAEPNLWKETWLPGIYRLQSIVSVFHL